MLTLKPTDDLVLVKELMLDPRTPLGVVDDPNNFEPNPTMTHLVGRKEDDTVVGLISIREVNNVTVEAHILIRPCFWGTGVSEELGEVFREGLLKYTTYTHIITYVPQTSFAVVKYLYGKGFKLVGTITRGCLIQGHPKNLLIFDLEIKRK